MGLGSFFASLFKKEDGSRKEIRELNIEPTQKKRSRDGQDGSRIEDISPVNNNGIKERGTADVDKSSSLGEREIPGEGTASPEEKERVPGRSSASGEKKAYYQAKRDLYHYLSQCMKTLYEADRQDAFESLAPFEKPSEEVEAALDRIREELPEKLSALLNPFVNENNTTDPSGLKAAFLSMLLPFYPAYRDLFGEFRYNTFLNRDALELFRRLTGRKYRLGYRNRYASGQPAFEWKGEQYKVYNAEGILLCDAVFEDGAIKNGYAVVPEAAGEDSDWSVLSKGRYSDGRFTQEAVEYFYKKPVDLA